jgi:putative SOS response-associated peptidase YedK
MCGRFSQQRPASELAEIFAAEPLADDPGPRFNVAPTDDALVVVQREQRRAITAYRWGLIPHWAENAKSARGCSTPVIAEPVAGLRRRSVGSAACPGRRVLRVAADRVAAAAVHDRAG